MREKNSDLRILRALAHEAPLTVYALAKKSGVAVSLVHKIVKSPENGLEPQRIVKVYSEWTWRTGLKRIEYVLTFQGLIEYFSLLFERREGKRSEVKRAVKKYAQFHNYPIFTEHDFLASLLGERVYELICSTGWLLKNHPPSIPIITKEVSGMLPTIIQSIRTRHRPPQIEWEEKILAYAFALMFFYLLALTLEGEKISSAPNPALYELIDKTCGELRQSLERSLEDVERIEDTLKKQFSA